MASKILLPDDDIQLAKSALSELLTAQRKKHCVIF